MVKCVQGCLINVGGEFIVLNDGFRYKQMFLWLSLVSIYSKIGGKIELGKSREENYYQGLFGF